MGAKPFQLEPGEIKSLLATTRQKYHIPALALVVVDSGNTLFAEIQGTTQFDNNVAAKLDDYFHIGSCSKSLLALMAGKLVEQGRLEWNTRFFDLYPELIAIAHPDYADITLEDLLLCRAGIMAFTTTKDVLPEIPCAIVNRRLAFIKYLLQQQPLTARTSKDFRFVYSNASYTMAAAMLEKVTEQNWEEQVVSIVTGELGLSVLFGWPNSHDSAQPWGHSQVPGESFRKHPPDDDYRIPDLIAPAGDLSMTPLDYARYLQLHLQGLCGQDNYLRSETYNYIHYRHKGMSLGVGNGCIGGLRFSNFDGSAGTFYCHSIIVPASGFAYAILANSGAPRAVKGIYRLSTTLAKRNYNWWWKFWM